MAYLIDTHAHLDFPQFKVDLDNVLDNACQAGVGPIINVGISERSSRQVVSMSLRYKQLWAAVGIHPHYSGKASAKYRQTLTELAGSPRVLAIGETGLDFYRNLSSREKQEQLFRAQLQLACELDKPVIIHSRSAHAETLAILKDEGLPARTGVMHCFSGDRKQAGAFLDMGLYISFAGPVTYPRSHDLRALLNMIPSDRLLLETDAPYLSPQPYRSLRNEPAFIKSTYERVALVLQIEPDKLAEQIHANASRFFGGAFGCS